MEELQRKQQEMLKVDDTEDNVGDGDGAYKTSLSGNGISGTTTAESSETEAICLIDDDDDDDDHDQHLVIPASRCKKVVSIMTENFLNSSSTR
jgi:hypothetical protein